MIRKYYIVFVSLLLLLMTTPQLALAMESVTAEIPFTIERTPGTVVIEAVYDEPLPDVTEIPDVLEGMFQITYSEPGNYHYRVYQIPGSNEHAKYDEIIYNVHVSVFVDEDTEVLYAVVTLGHDGIIEKPEKIVFANTLGNVSPEHEDGDNDKDGKHDASSDSESRDPNGYDEPGGSLGDGSDGDPNGDGNGGNGGYPNENPNGVGNNSGSNGNSPGGAGASWLPQTGQLWWPVPVMIGFGILLILLGIMISSKSRKDSEQ